MSDDETTGDSAPAAALADEFAADAAAKLKAILSDAADKKKAFDEQIDSAVGAIETALNNMRASTTALESVRNDASTIKSGIESEASKAQASVLEIEGFKTAAATSKGGIDEMQRSAASETGTIGQLKLDIEKVHSEAVALSGKATIEHDDINKKISALQDRQVALEKLLNEVTALSADAKQKSESVAQDVSAIDAAKKTFDALLPQAQAQYDTLSEKQTAATKLAGEIVGLNENVKTIHAVLFEDTPARKAVKTDVDELHDKIRSVLQSTEQQRDESIAQFGTFRTKSELDLENLRKDQSGSFSQLYEKLQNQILSLLPSAGSA